MKEPILHAFKGLFKIKCTFVSRICSIFQISKDGGICREKVKRKLRMCVFVCVGGEGVLTIF